jgi:hypothetical protein
MAEDPVGSLLCRLYDLCRAKRGDRGGNRVREGHKFEDEASEQVYYYAREVGLDPNPSRTTLDLPTRSGNLHQFDALLMSGNEYVVVECKNTKEAAKDYLYYFNAKIRDYLEVANADLAMRGIFLSTVSVAESAWRYGLAYGIRIVDPVSPPPEYMLRGDLDESLAAGIRGVLEEMHTLSRSLRGDDTLNLLNEYRFLCGRWKDA